MFKGALLEWSSDKVLVLAQEVLGSIPGVSLQRFFEIVHSTSLISTQREKKRKLELNLCSATRLGTCWSLSLCGLRLKEMEMQLCICH